MTPIYVTTACTVEFTSNVGWTTLLLDLNAIEPCLVHETLFNENEPVMMILNNNGLKTV